MTYALLIDDAPGIRDSLQRLAEMSGLELSVAASWDEGLAMFQVLSPELVIVDYNLPGSTNGLQLLAEIRRLSPSVRLILLSGYIDEADTVEIEALGIVDRAIPKALPGGSNEILLQEMADAKERAAISTDWLAYAAARTVAQSIDQSEIDELDIRLKRNTGR